MKILQMDVNNITYEPTAPEASVYEDAKREKTSIDNTMVIFVSVENGDTEAMAEKAVRDTEEFMRKLERKKILVYPFAHLSNNLSEPKEAMRILQLMGRSFGEGYEVKKAPFGWTKKMSIDIKGHPLAEQSRSYSPAGETKIYKKVKPMKLDESIVRKSDWSGLPDTDHRTIGEKLDLYSFQEVSPGMVYWHPNGFMLYRQLQEFLRAKLDAYGYREISAPAVANLVLWKVSGHLEHYVENMFKFDTGEADLGLKPMNCPSTIMIYKSSKWSYRDLPLRLATFDKIYRNEVSGALTGLFRVREITLDDAHIFATESQLPEELESLIKLVKEVYDTFGLPFKARLSTMPDSHMGDERLWEQAEGILKMALESHNIPYELKPKDGAFYGPKIDFDVTDSMGRDWQCATIQLDYQMPQRFVLEYTGEDGKAHAPIIIHRALFGSLERFIGIMTEHYKGKFPTWLAPTQVAVVSISEQVADYAAHIHKELKGHGIRSALDVSDKTLEYKIRDAKMREVPYTIILGRKEKEAKTISVRTRDNVQKNQLKLADFIGTLGKEVSERKNKLQLS
ncbi:MAG: threonine--tRNA ligase [Candidatus Micrarchaeota archaeon]|nr:threonine--tRNA ligase [Candidatus Micrarchaeota archaeon]